MQDDRGFWEEIEKGLERHKATLAKGGPRFTAVDWLSIFGKDFDMQWLVEELWPMGRQIHIHAQRKTGKSLVSLYIAAWMANGVDPFTGAKQMPVIVGYYDFEMTEEDVLERVTDMGFTPETLGNLHYYLHPPMRPLDTRQGGEELVANAIAQSEQVVFIDTLSRVVQGEENSNDTYINFYRYTGGPLKNAGISLARTDHEGHEGGRSRGASSKADDVDIVWQLKPTDDGFKFIRAASRVSYIPEELIIRKHEGNTLGFSRAEQAWPKGTKEKVDELNALKAPIDITKAAAIALLKANGYVVGRTQVLVAALSYRRTRQSWL